VLPYTIHYTSQWIAIAAVSIWNGHLTDNIAHVKNVGHSADLGRILLKPEGPVFL